MIANGAQRSREPAETIRRQHNRSLMQRLQIDVPPKNPNRSRPHSRTTTPAKANLPSNASPPSLVFRLSKCSAPKKLDRFLQWPLMSLGTLSSRKKMVRFCCFTMQIKMESSTSRECIVTSSKTYKGFCRSMVMFTSPVMVTKVLDFIDWPTRIEMASLKSRN